MSTGFLFVVMKMFQNRGDSCTTLNVLNTPEWCTLHGEQFDMLLYLNKAVMYIKNLYKYKYHASHNFILI